MLPKLSEGWQVEDREEDLLSSAPVGRAAVRDTKWLRERSVEAEACCAEASKSSAVSAGCSTSAWVNSSSSTTGIPGAGGSPIDSIVRLNSWPKRPPINPRGGCKTSIGSPGARPRKPWPRLQGPRLSLGMV